MTVELSKFEPHVTERKKKIRYRGSKSVNIYPSLDSNGPLTPSEFELEDIDMQEEEQGKEGPKMIINDPLADPDMYCDQCPHCTGKPVEKEVSTYCEQCPHCTGKPTEKPTEKPVEEPTATPRLVRKKCLRRSVYLRFTEDLRELTDTDYDLFYKKVMDTLAIQIGLGKHGRRIGNQQVIPMDTLKGLILSVVHCSTGLLVNVAMDVAQCDRGLLQIKNIKVYDDSGMFDFDIVFNYEANLIEKFGISLKYTF